VSSHKYDRVIDLTADDAHTRLIRLVGEGKRVLELGCATGYMSKVLVEQFGCTVIGVEVDAEAAEAARKACARVIVGDVEVLNWSRELGPDRFDVIVCADVLEHLREPGRTLAALKPFLAPDGYVVASIPNVAHAAVLAELLAGRFRYRPLGLLDEGHVRLFTRDTISECFERAGLAVTHLERLLVEPEATEFRTDLARLPAEWRAAIRAHDESTTYQFVLAARPAPGGSTRALAEAVAPMVHASSVAEGRPPAPAGEADFWRTRVEGLIDAIVARMHALEADRARLAGELDELGARAAHLQGEVDTHIAHLRFLQDAVASRDRELRTHVEATQRELEARERQLAGLQAEVAERETRLAEITASAGWRWLARWRRARRAAFPPGSRRERMYRAIHRIAFDR